jgi:CheY-like chemotaxis protein/HPt (histidine-containing phosphotransfer) domain-containing protein
MMHRDRSLDPERGKLCDQAALQTPAPAADRLCVLVAEDNAVNQEVAIGILESLDCEVTVVDNGAAALSAYQTSAPGRFDVILMDCQMPVMDGFDAARHIRAWESGGAHIPVLALTANDVGGVGAACRDAGMDDVLSKPFRRQTLQALLDRWCPKEEVTPLPDPEPARPLPASVLDQRVLQSLRDLDPDGSKGLLSRTIAKFSSYGDELIAALTASVRNHDLPEVARFVHSLKSSSANLGAVDLASQCQMIEALIREQQGTLDLSQPLDALTRSYQQAREALLTLASA